MKGVETNVPAEGELLCEHCGYGLSGLPPGGNCPECGNPTADSRPELRHPAPWERKKTIASFLIATAQVVFHPARFYRTLSARRDRRGSFWFAQIHWAIASILFGWGTWVHSLGFVFFPRGSPLEELLMPVVGIATYALGGFVVLQLGTSLAARLTHWEATYRGLRLPTQTVLRAMDFHVAHYGPVAIIFLFTTLGYRWIAGHHLFRFIDDQVYIYVICGEVIVGAVYLFLTYWAAMRNLMYAN